MLVALDTLLRVANSEKGKTAAPLAVVVLAVNASSVNLYEEIIEGRIYS